MRTLSDPVILMLLSHSDHLGVCMQIYLYVVSFVMCCFLPTAIDLPMTVLPAFRVTCCRISPSCLQVAVASRAVGRFWTPCGLSWLSVSPSLLMVSRCCYVLTVSVVMARSGCEMKAGTMSPVRMVVVQWQALWGWLWCRVTELLDLTASVTVLLHVTACLTVLLDLTVTGCDLSDSAVGFDCYRVSDCCWVWLLVSLWQCCWVWLLQSLTAVGFDC